MALIIAFIYEDYSLSLQKYSKYQHQQFWSLEESQFPISLVHQEKNLAS